MKIDKPGIYPDISEADYRNDPCPEPSLTQSLCKLALERSMRRVRTESPALNPDWIPDDDPKFDLGNVAHKLVLGRGKAFEVIDFDDWRTKAAKDARAEAAAVGKIAVLSHQFEQAQRMAAAAVEQIERHQERDVFTAGKPEVMIAWQEDGIWCRALIDWLGDDMVRVDDLKTTAMSVAPHLLGFRAEAAGWHIQSAFIERGLDALHPAAAGHRKFRFVAQETDEPHDLVIFPMTEHWITMGRKKVSAAVSLWRASIETGRWPGYGNRPIVPEYPASRENSWLERELSGEFETDYDHKLIMAG